MQRSKMIIVAGAVIAVLVVAVGVLGWKYYQASHNSAAKNKETSSRIIKAVSNIYMVPTDEEPTVALIQDKQKLENQEFFKNTNNGDYLLLYQKAKLAIVYRESARKLVTVGPVNINSAQNASDASKPN